MALKVAVVAPAATVTEAGTVSRVLLLASVTLDPPVGAIWVRVTVQVLTALCPRLAGLHATPETSTGARQTDRGGLRTAAESRGDGRALIARDAAAAVALKVAVVAPAATVTEAGTVSEALLLASVTLEPPVGAVWVRVTVQVLTALCPRAGGIARHARNQHRRQQTDGGGLRTAAEGRRHGRALIARDA